MLDPFPSCRHKTRQKHKGGSFKHLLTEGTDNKEQLKLLPTKVPPSLEQIQSSDVAEEQQPFVKSGHLMGHQLREEPCWVRGA